MILHSHGCPSTTSDAGGTYLEQMSFTAYITGQEGQKSEYKVAILRIAQIFAADIMPVHCQNYAAKCATPRVPVDVMAFHPRPASDTISISPLAHSSSPTSYSQYTFQGYPAGILESYLLQLYRPGILPRTSSAMPLTLKVYSQSTPPMTPSSRTTNSHSSLMKTNIALQDASAMRMFCRTKPPASASKCLSKDEVAAASTHWSHSSRHRNGTQSNPFGIILVKSSLNFCDSIGSVSAEDADECLE